MSEELTDAQAAELIADLKALQAQLSAALTSSAAGAKPVDLDEAIGRVSRIDAIQQQSMVQASRANLTTRLSQIAAASVRLVTCSRSIMAETCSLTVPAARSSRLAISELVKPLATRARISD